MTVVQEREAETGRHGRWPRRGSILGGLNHNRFAVNILDIMKGMSLRICAAILVLAFVVGLPMQGTAMSSQMSLAATSGIPMPDGCDTCGDNPTANTCPVVFCIGLSAVLLDKQASAPIPLVTASLRIDEVAAGLSRGPDPYPPRTSFLF